MTMVYKNLCLKVHMGGGELPKKVDMKHSETRVTPLERGVTTKPNWEKTMKVTGGIGQGCRDLTSRHRRGAVDSLDAGS